MATFEASIGSLVLRDLPGAIDPAALSALLQPKDVGFAGDERPDEAMMNEAINNRFLSEAFEASRGLIGIWNLTEIMLRAYVEPIKWKNSDQFRSHLGIPLLAEHFYSILSTVQQALFSGYRPFQLDPTAGTSIDAAKAQELLVLQQLKSCGYKGGTFKQEMRGVVYDGLLYGTGCGIMGWETKTITVKKKRAVHKTTTVVTPDGGVATPDGSEDELEDYDDKLEINHPIFEHVPIRRIRVSPDCRRANIRTAAWAGRLIYLDSYDLDALRDVEGFNIPTQEQLVALTTPQKQSGGSVNPMDTQGGTSNNPVFQQTTTPMKAYPENYSDSTVDPLGKKWEIFEYWTPRRVVWVLEGEYCLRNASHDLNSNPFVSFAFREAPDSFYGYGLGFWLTDFQRIAQGIVNAFFDDMNLNLMGVYTSPAGMNNTAQSAWIFPGKVFKSDGQNKMEPMTRNGISAQEPLSVIAQVKAWAAQITGAGAGVQGGNPGKAGDMRTPAGVEMIQQGEATKGQDLIDQISELVFVPFIEFCIEQNRRLKPSQIRQMLSEELGKAYKMEPLNMINGQYKVKISAGARLAARESLNKSLGFITSILQAPGTPEMLAVQAMKMNFTEMVKALFESTGYPYEENIIVAMTDDDKKRLAAQQQQPTPDEKRVSLETASKKEIDDNQAENRAILQAGKHVTDTAKQQQESVQQAAMMRAERSSEMGEDKGFTGGV